MSYHSDSLRTPDTSFSHRKSSGSHSEDLFEEEEEDGFSGSEPEELFDDGTIRYFIAIFDYNPSIMSPNIDGAEEELQFKEGDMIKVIFYSLACIIGGRVRGKTAPPPPMASFFFFTLIFASKILEKYRRLQNISSLMDKTADAE